jgi:hypothetical protein
MKEIGNAKISILFETVSPLTHMMGTEGNEAMINREVVFNSGKKCTVPVVSGNAIRHKIIRYYGAKYLVDTLGLYGKLNVDQAFFLFNGGNLMEGSTTDNTKKIADMQLLFPLFRLLGGALTNQIISGSLIVNRAILLCEENRDRLNYFLRDEYSVGNNKLKTADNFISNYQYTRGDITREKNEIIAEKVETEQKEKSNLMIYSGEAVVSGAIFIGGFILHGVSRLEVGALLHSIAQWQTDGACIGGYSRIGHGKVKTMLIYDDVEDLFDDKSTIENVINEYEEHVVTHKEESVQWLNEAFKKRENSKVVKQKVKKSDKEEEVEDVKELESNGLFE